GRTESGYLLKSLQGDNGEATIGSYFDWRQREGKKKVKTETARAVLARESAFMVFSVLSKPGSIGEECIRDSLATGQLFPDAYAEELRKDRLNADALALIEAHRSSWGVSEYEAWAREFVAASGPAKDAQRQAA